MNTIDTTLEEVETGPVAPSITYLFEQPIAFDGIRSKITIMGRRSDAKNAFEVLLPRRRAEVLDAQARAKGAKCEVVPGSDFPGWAIVDGVADRPALRHVIDLAREYGASALPCDVWPSAWWVAMLNAKSNAAKKVAT